MSIRYNMTQHKIMQILDETTGWMSTKEIADELGKTTNAINTALSTLNEFGFVEVHRPRSNNEHFKYKVK